QLWATAPRLDSGGQTFGGGLDLHRGDGTRTIALRAASHTNSAGLRRFYTNTGQPRVEITGQAADGNGRVKTPKLAITGGADLSEHFDIAAGEDAIQPGMVVCIDPSRPGKLKLSVRAYDRTVAGVVSGAGGVEPGLTLSQTGTLADGRYPVAL